jgi:putative glutamine amidotransferase
MIKFLLPLFSAIILFPGAITSSYGQVRIAVSKTSGNYEAWIHAADPDAVIVNMYGMTVDSALFVLSTCHGLLLTGGEDVNPSYYGKSNEVSKCGKIDDYRDSLELALINRAIIKRIPVFGICRGEQILNVALGGTLITDIPTDYGKKEVHSSINGSEDPLHTINIGEGSDLYQITGVENGTVNSSHHQAVDLVAPGMKITALSGNGIAEAIERELPLGKSFIMGVQWHPERLEKNPGLSKPLAEYFIDKIKDYRQSNKACCGAH